MSRGVCGKQESTANLQDLLIYVLQGAATCAEFLPKGVTREQGVFMSQALFSTITNANFDDEAIAALIRAALKQREQIKAQAGAALPATLPTAATWTADSLEDFKQKAFTIGILSYSDNEDIRSLKSLLLFGLKGIAAYADHAAMLGILQ